MIINVEIVTFKDMCSLYPQQISENIKKGLIKSLYERIYRIFVIQMKHIVKSIMDSLKYRIKTLLKFSTENDQVFFWKKFREIIKTLEDETEKMYKERVEYTVDTKCGWETESHYLQFKEMVQEELNNLKDKEISKIQGYLKKSYKVTLIQPLNNEIIKLSNDTYSQLTKNYNDAVLQIRSLALHIYRIGFQLSENQLKEILNQLFLEFYKIGNDEMKKISEDLHVYAIKRFRILFCKDASNKQRNFRTMNDSEIQKLYDQQTNMFLKIIDKFRYSPLFVLTDTCIIKDLNAENLCVSEGEKKFDYLLSEKALKETKEKFLLQAEDELDLARKRTDSLFKRLFDIPFIAWILIAYFLYEKHEAIFNLNPTVISIIILFVILYIIIEWMGISKNLYSFIFRRLFASQIRHTRLD